MLRFTEQVGGDMRRLRLIISYDEKLAGASNHVDSYGPVEQPFGRRHINIPWSNDLVDLCDGFCPIRKRGNSLNTAHAIDLRHPSDVSRNQQVGINPLFLRRGDHYNA